MDSIYNELFYLLPLALALLLGGMIGWQRYHWGQSAGPRTYALVTAGSTLFTILSTVSFGNDTARVAAGIVTGIGFLGAGTILKRENHIEGLTTAAGMWAAAAIGMSIGVGYYFLAIAITMIILLLLMFHEQNNKKKKQRKS